VVKTKRIGKRKMDVGGQKKERSQEAGRREGAKLEWIFYFPA
jgi:hypothetical protein